MSLLNALDRFEHSALTKKKTERLRAKLLRYQIRMSTRPTPYGLFAGCAIVPIGTRTDVTIRSTFGRSHTRPDMAWMMDLVRTAECDLAIRRWLRLVRNPLIRFEGDRISLATRMPTGREEDMRPVSARATGVVKLALDLTKNAIEYETLAARLGEVHPFATGEKVDRLLTELWEQTFLLTDLRPPLTTDSPAQYVLDRLAGIPDAAALHDKLESILNAVAAWDGLSHEESVSGFRALLNEAGGPEGESKGASLQVDLALSIDGGLGSGVAEEAARAAELLLRLSPSPRGMSTLAAYRNAFVSRYGREREVPLLELLDPDRGLGSVSVHSHAYVGPDQGKSAQRSAVLQALACTALHKRQRVIRLDDNTLQALETWRSLPETAPISLDINVLVAARSADAIAAGHFTVVVGPNLGAWAAGRNFGRFAHLFAQQQSDDPLRVAASAEQSNHLCDHLWVEVVFLPSNVRSANVAVRPAVRSHEVVFGVSPGVAGTRVIPLEELLVGVTNERFYVQWPAAGRRLHFVSGHMLNPHGAPAVAQFLLQVAYDGMIPFTPFDWGPAETFSFLPRVQAGRVVLRPAEWKISKEVMDLHGTGTLDKWRIEWDVPRYIFLTVGDNRLVLDLDLPDHVKQIMAGVKTLKNGQSLLIQEVLPALDDAWLTGEEGRYYGEFIIPLVRPPSCVEGQSVGTTDVEEVATAQLDHESSDRKQLTPSDMRARRQHPPGSEWLFVKLYCPSHREDDLIGDSLLGFVNNVIASGLADNWFFIRYADPESHIRVRFHGTPDQLSSHLFGQVCQWARGLMETGACVRFVFDTYDQEVERFGGPDGMSVSESLFQADSRAAVELVKVLKSQQWAEADDRTALFALTTDDLLRTIGFDDAQCLNWYKVQVGAARDAGQEYRKLKDILRAALGDSSRWLAEKPFGSVIESALLQRRHELAYVSRRLRQLADVGHLDQPMDALIASYIHLHLNRLGAAPGERRLLGVLLRTRVGLAKAPATQTITVT
jgi:thiopeptide-type bacteriocin biosynthesis protein